MSPCKEDTLVALRNFVKKYTIHLSKTQTSIPEGGYKDFLYYFQMKMRGASK